MNMQKTMIGQFKKPHGLLGNMAGWIMAYRTSNRERNLWTVDLLNVQPGDWIVEIGCGPGLALETCLARTKNGHVVGLDHSQTMIHQAKARNTEAYNKKRLELQRGTLDELNVKERLFDKVYSANVVQFFPDQAAAFRKIYSILKPNGLAATTYMPRSKNPSREKSLAMANEVKQHMGDTGFINIRVEELPLEPAPAICVIGEHP